MDFIKSIMLISDEYMASVKEFQQVKMNATQEKERLCKEKEECKKKANREEERLAKEAQAI